MIPENVKGGAALTVAALTIAAFTVLAREVSPMLASMPQTAARFLLAAGWLLATNRIRRKKLRTCRGDAALLLPLGMLSMMLGILLVIAVTHTSVSSALSVLYASGIIAALPIGAAFFGETITAAKAVAVTVALIGLALHATGMPMNAGIVAAAAGGVCDSASNALRKRMRHTDPSAAVMWQYAIGGTLLTLLLCAFGHIHIGTVSVRPVAALFLFAGLSVILGRMQFYGFARLDVNAGAVILSTQVLWAMLLGLAIVHEHPNLREAVGSVLIFTAAVISAAGSSSATAKVKRRYQHETGNQDRVRR